MKFTVSKLQGLLQADWRQIFSAYIVNTGNSEMDRDPVQIIMILIITSITSLNLKSQPGLSAADVENVTQSPVS